MATLYRKKSPVTGRPLATWYCFFRVPVDGGFKQVHRATGKLTKKEAFDAAAEFEAKALDEAGAGDVKSRKILSKLTEAGELAMRGRLNPAKAWELINEIMEIGSGEKLAEFTVKGWVAGWLREKKNTGSAPATYSSYKTATNLLLESLGSKADLHLDSVTAADVRTFRDSIRENGRTGRTANTQLKIVRSCLSDAAKAHAILRNPAADVKILPEDDSTERAPFTLPEAVRLLKAAPSDDWRGLITVALFTGLRLGDASRLKVGNLDLERKVVRLMPSKTRAKKRMLEIPLHPEVLAFLATHPLSSFAAAPLFSTFADRKVGGKNGLSLEFARIMDDAEVPRMTTRTSDDGAARKMSQRSFHSLRHTAASLMANAGVSSEMRMSITGHTTKAAHEGYTHLELEPIRAASLPVAEKPKARKKAAKA